MRIGYSKLGRSIMLPASKWSVKGGDIDAPNLLRQLAERHPEHEFVLVGRNSGETAEEAGLPSNVINPWHEWRDVVPYLTDTPKQRKTLQRMRDVIQEMDDLTRETIVSCDAHVMWLGQHGTSNQPIPVIGKSWKDGDEVLTSPYVSSVNYGAYILRGLADWQDQFGPEREPILLCPDTRNYVKCRDLKWPPRNSVIAQYDMKRPAKHERFGDKRTPRELGYKAKWEGSNIWVTQTTYTYDALEITALPGPEEVIVNDEPGEIPFGIILNENRKEVKDNRKKAVEDWVFPLTREHVYGVWSKKTCEEWGQQIEHVPYNELWKKLQTFSCTLTTPASGSGWATAKPWECFAAGVVCFFHPRYDDQGHIIPTLKQLKQTPDKWSDEFKQFTRWLRLEKPEDLVTRVRHINDNPDAWRWIVQKQRMLYEWAYEEKQCVKEIELRLGL